MCSLPPDLEMRLARSQPEDRDAFCRHDRTELRRRVQRNGSIVYRHQCLDCGYGVGNAVPKATVAGSPPPYDEEAEERYHAERQARYQMRQAEQRAEFFAWYDEYLQTDEWRRKRAAVLKRDNNVCQGCGDRASQVHHLSYAHVGAEFLFELMAVCRACHERLHEK